MNAIAESSFLNLIAVAVLATGGLFLTVVLGGVLSAVLTLGALELHFRQSIQRRVLAEHFERLTEASTDLDQVLRSARVDPEALYRLHYRQIAGHLATVVNSEAAAMAEPISLAGPDDPRPLTDLLSGRRRAGSDLPPPRDERALIDLALREIDVIQARLGSSLTSATFPYVCIAWILVYVPALLIAALNLPFRFDGPPFQMFMVLMQFVTTIAVALLVALVLPIGSAVVGSVIFTWLDRILATK